MLSLFLFITVAVQAQTLPGFVTALVEERAEEGASAEDLVLYYERLLRQPLNLNDASRLQLEETGLFTLFQVESLLAWRERYGAVRSATEWALVEGFTPEVVAQLRPFFTLGEPSAAKAANTPESRPEKAYAIV